MAKNHLPNPDISISGRTPLYPTDASIEALHPHVPHLPVMAYDRLPNISYIPIGADSMNGASWFPLLVEVDCLEAPKLSKVDVVAEETLLPRFVYKHMNQEWVDMKQGLKSVVLERDRPDKLAGWKIVQCLGAGGKELNPAGDTDLSSLAFALSKHAIEIALTKHGRRINPLQYI